ncbi:hypothetical protein [Ohtaekwangia sp.]|uniref:hypothetical protein n=1 Tax=Ohtaekwangia sp. TaxID=2066019 RepID=UPI002FDD7D92
MKRILPFLLFLFSVIAHAQTTVLENNPTGIHWYQVNTPHFRVLFPKGFEEQAQRMANTLEYIHDPEAKSLGTRPRKISVILQNQSSQSNAFVSILPRRSEFYTMPPQDYNFIGTGDWLNMLASHEYRHVVQYQHATRGFNRLIYYIFGTPTLAGMAQAAAPQWFWEGDAVVTETAFTRSGRGKIPYFNLVFRTNLLEGRTFNYHKQYLRSYKHNIPNHYVLGYNMVSYLRKKTNDPEIWGKITARSWNVPFIPFAFSNAIHNKTNRYVTGLYTDMATELRKEWQKEIDQLKLTSFEKVNVRSSSAYTDYFYPQPQEDGSILVMKSGIGDIEQFVLLKDGQEKKVFTPGFINDAGMLSTAENSVVWNEYGYDPRWLVKNFSLIKIYDYKTKQKRVIGGRHERYGSAALSPKGDKIVTVRSDNGYHNTLLVLELFTGKVLKEFDNPQNYFYSMPRWSDDGSKIIVLKTTATGKTITLVDAASGAETDLLPVSKENAGHPVLYGKYVFFNSPSSGIDNIYAIDLETKQRYQVTTSRLGAYNAAVSKDGKSIYYNDQSRDGLDVVKIPFDPAAWQPVNNVVIDDTEYKHLVEQEGRPMLFDSIPQQTLPVKRYSKLKGMINPFSWGPYLESNLTRADFGITSRDILSTTTITTGYTYDINERDGFWRAGVSYQGLFPIVDVNVTKGSRSTTEDAVKYAKVVGRDTTLVTQKPKFQWDEENVEAGLRIPLVTTSSRFYGAVNIGNYIGYTRVTNFRNNIDGGGRLFPSNYPQYFFRDYQDHGNLLYNHFSVSAQRLMKRSRRDINSKWGQAIFMHVLNTPYGGDYSGNQFSFYGLGYFPGLFKHHSFYGYWAYQYSDIATTLNVKTGEGLDNYTFRNWVPLPRGQSVARFRNFYSMSGNYTLPLWYPDIALGPLLNVQRVRANLFFDYGYGSTVYPKEVVSQEYVSTGAEMKFDINIMRFLPQIDVGFRYSYGIRPSVTKFELLIGTFNF